ncbi:flagellar basal-body rod modification protein FlgD [Bacillus ectoiniformans]|uniref:flagellar hook assembly protein FlgD n=1 Tax=Bacillus ectoiniformans TaxID=1494429 RepID=UPI00195D9A75|nr:flagellar hook assembly protein FlgD [Bacillus ectoiniformans]MBM7647127.1 flagellar basal-body rod modification protein FlgD [Bacillus ectoiniformans]
MVQIDPNLYLDNNRKQPKTGNSALGKDEFLKILMTQLQNQDPMNPLEDKDFIAQMATFSSLEQMTNMASSFDKFLQMQQSSSMISYNSFVGKEVLWHKITESTDPEVEPVIQEGTGTITSIRFKGEGVEFVLADGTVLEPANISEVKSGSVSSGNPLVDASHLIGKSVSFEKDGTEQTSLVQSVSMKNGAVWLQLQNGEKISSSALTKIG